MADIRPSPIAGTWYEGRPEALSNHIHRLLEAAPATVRSAQVVALIAPHAGYRYSGQVAAFAYGCIRGLRPELVAIVSPYHHPHPIPVLISAHQAYSTPLGVIQIDAQLVTDFISRMPAGSVGRLANDQEHSLEIQLPFLQQSLADPFRLLPIMLAAQNETIVLATGRVLAELLASRSALLIASTDLSHFQSAETAHQLDMEMLARIKALDPLAVLRAEQQGLGYACGRGAVAAVIEASRTLGGDAAQILHYANSSEVNKDTSSVVGYAAAAIYRSQPE